MEVIRRLRQRKWANLFTIYLRYLIGGSFVFASIVKIQGRRFTQVSGADAPINDAWHLFETLYHSGIYWNFLGWGQLIAGLLLMTQRFATLGAVIFLPIILNIFFITLSYDFKGTVFITGLILLATLYLLLWDYKKLLPLVGKEVSVVECKEHKVSGSQLWIVIGLVLFIVTVSYVLIYDRLPSLWMGICIFIGCVGLLINSLANKYFKK